VCEGVSDGLSPRPFGDDAADWKMRAEVWRDRDAAIGGSDAGAHLDMMCRAINTTSLLGHSAREHQVVTLEEALRWEPPISTVVRVARRGCELGGIAIPAGTSVSVSVAAANRDPEQNPEPDGSTRRGRTSRI
jgi:cytochrome P450